MSQEDYKEENVNQEDGLILKGLIGSRTAFEEKLHYFNTRHADDSSIFQHVMVKKIKDGCPTIPQERREAEILEELNHPNILKCYGWEFLESIEQTSRKRQEHLVIQMEYCPGQITLDYEIRKRRFKSPIDYYEEDEIMKRFLQIASALREVHKNHLVHRGLTPKAIFILEEEIKLGGFGESVKLEYQDELRKSICGEDSYRSPEACHGEEYNHSSDIWALGVLLYYMCTFRNPFEGITKKQSRTNIIEGIDLDPVVPRYSEGLQHLLDRLLIRIPGQRPNIEDIFEFQYVKSAIESRRLSDFLNRLSISPSMSSQDLENSIEERKSDSGYLSNSSGPFSNGNDSYSISSGYLRVSSGRPTIQKVKEPNHTSHPGFDTKSTCDDETHSESHIRYSKISLDLSKNPSFKMDELQDAIPFKNSKLSDYPNMNPKMKLNIYSNKSKLDTNLQSSPQV
ncbi:unnamed protein product [Moneuplotes crassus]|uniref:non-specific serine/threonine protein kinase n=1 Tax=Euplotes crassus TaxID=5936 RepID=A0AAD1UJH2_EUPCR|nr:unnamed protein product [Moneuplotes crassus]